MSYEQKAYSKFNRVVKKKHDPLQEAIFSAQDEVAEDPDIGKQLKGKLRNWYSYSFSHGGQSYRLAYKKDDDNEQVIFGSVGTREEIYDDLKGFLQNLVV